MKKRLLIIVLLICIFLTGCENKYKLSDNEAVAYTTMRLAIAKSETDGSGEISEKCLNTLKNVVKNQNKNNNWFNNYNGAFYAKCLDTSDTQIDLICNDDYCAKLTVKNNNTNYDLIDYSFSENTEKNLSKINIVK